MELNKEQLKAVTTTANKVVVIAAPAVGKTRVLTERIKWLLDNGAKKIDCFCRKTDFVCIFGNFHLFKS